MIGLALLRTYWRPLAGVAALVALWGAYQWWAGHQRAIGADAERAIWTKAAAAQKAEARTELDAANARVAAAENAVRVARDAQNLKDAQNAKITSDLERKLLAAGRLRDPNGCGGRATSGATDTVSPGSGTDNTPQSAGLLSKELSGLLRTLTREADAVNLAYIASRADADQLRGLLGACGKPTP